MRTRQVIIVAKVFTKQDKFKSFQWDFFIMALFVNLALDRSNRVFRTDDDLKGLVWFIFTTNFSTGFNCNTQRLRGFVTAVPGGGGG